MDSGSDSPGEHLRSLLSERYPDRQTDGETGLGTNDRAAFSLFTPTWLNPNLSAVFPFFICHLKTISVNSEKFDLTSCIF